MNKSIISLSNKFTIEIKTYHYYILPKGDKASSRVQPTILFFNFLTHTHHTQNPVTHTETHCTGNRRTPTPPTTPQSTSLLVMGYIETIQITNNFIYSTKMYDIDFEY